MKAIINQGTTYKVTGERGDFFITEDNKGKLKMFAKNTVEVVEIESMPKAKIFKKIAKSSQAVIDADYKNFKKRMAEAEYFEHKF